MSSWKSIEEAIVAALRDLAQGEAALLATVKGYTRHERRQLQAAIGRELLPAAYVVAEGREASAKGSHRPGALHFSVLLATRSRRSEDEARGGSPEIAGIFTLSEQVAGALDNTLVATDRRLLLVDERRIGGEESVIVWEQSYAVRRQSELSAPTFGEAALAGADSQVQVEVGGWRRATSAFAFPGVDGVFKRDLGVRGRAIVWRGQLRAASDAALNDIESAIEDELHGGSAKTLADAWGREYAECVLESFQRVGPRRHDELSGEALQEFEMEFTQAGV